jgi:hypothetical protein
MNDKSHKENLAGPTHITWRNMSVVKLMGLPAIAARHQTYYDN